MLALLAGLPFELLGAAAGIAIMVWALLRIRTKRLTIRVRRPRRGEEKLPEPGEELPTREGALLKITRFEDVAVVSFTKDRILEQRGVQQVGEEFNELFEKHRFTKIVLNLEDVKFLSSAFVGQFLNLRKKLEAARGGLMLCNLSHEIAEVLKVPFRPPDSQLASGVRESLDEAIRELRKLKKR